MMEGFLVPHLAQRIGSVGVIRREVFRTFGLTEAMLDQRLAGAPFDPEEVHLGFKAVFPETHVIVTVRADNEAGAEELIAKAERFLRERAGEYLYARGDRPLEEIVGRLLRDQRKTLALAESCTGGMIASRITSISGSSDYFERCAVTYSNRAKMEILGVSGKTLAEHGAVSEQCAREMAEGIRRISGADLGLSTTGIAGPTGGTKEKPVGTVFMALAHEGATLAREFRFPGDRSAVRTLTTQTALYWLWKYLTGREP